MAVVQLRGPLKQRAGDRAQHEIEGATVLEVLGAIERAEPELQGWILDERGTIRRHIKVWVNGAPGEAATAVGAGDRIDVLPAISGG